MNIFDLLLLTPALGLVALVVGYFFGLGFWFGHTWRFK